jgi:predicted metal-dependent phosphoesterase TrpH
MFGVEFLDTVRHAGAFAIQAHPFRERPYMTSGKIFLTPDHVDALEIRNCGNPPEIDRRAYEYAKLLGKPMTGGSDNHVASGENKPLSGIELPFRCQTVHHLIAAIRDGKNTVIDAETAKNAPLSDPQYSVTVL